MKKSWHGLDHVRKMKTYEISFYCMYDEKSRRETLIVQSEKDMVDFIIGIGQYLKDQKYDLCGPFPKVKQVSSIVTI